MRLFQLDTALGLVIFTLSLFASLNFYQQVVDFERPDSPLEGIRAGQESYRFLGPDGCVGSFSTSLEEDKGYEFKAEGTLRLALDKTSLDAQLVGEAYFNSLGQLGGSVFNITIAENKITLGTTGVNPVEFRFKSSAEADGVAWSRKFPGPIELVKSQNGSYSLRHFALRQDTRGQATELIQKNIQGLLGLSIEEVDDRESLAACENINTALDLAPFMKLAEISAGLSPNSIGKDFFAQFIGEGS
jgi:hypothetical protein